jgi:hypothetical protein
VAETTHICTEICKSKIKVLVGLFPLEASLFSLQMATFSLCPHMAFSPYECTFCISSSFSKQNTSTLD